MERLKAQCDALCAQRNEISREIIEQKPLPLSIIAISKGQSKEKILPLLEAGHQAFGENRIQEAEEKWRALKLLYPKTELHFVGALQTNKLDQALDLFDFIHALDRPKLALALKQKQDEGVCLPKLFIQINLGEEKQKSGIELKEADDFIAQCLRDKLPVIGLMGLPPLTENPAPHFALLREMAARHNLAGLSMGMSGSLEAAILLGATYIRPGTIIFGERSQV